MNNLIEKFNSRKDVIKLYDFMNINKNLNNFEKYQVSSNTNPSVSTAFNLDADDLIINVLISEINQNFIRKILKVAFNTPKFDYLDLRPNGSLMTGRANIDKLVNMIISSGYKNVVTAGSIASELQDSHFFNHNSFKNSSISTTSTFYTIGKLSDVNVWVDPYMKYNDGRLCMFNTIDINIGDIELREIIPPTSFTPRLIVEYGSDFIVYDSKLIFVIENENSEAYSQYKSLQRDIKIDNILDGECI